MVKFNYDLDLNKIQILNIDGVMKNSAFSAHGKSCTFQRFQKNKNSPPNFHHLAYCPPRTSKLTRPGHHAERHVQQTHP